MAPKTWTCKFTWERTKAKTSFDHGQTFLAIWGPLTIRYGDPIPSDGPSRHFEWLAHPLGPTAHCDTQAVGGTEEGVLAVTTTFYRNVFADPILGVMFKVHEASHAQKLALFLLYFMEVSDTYFRQPGVAGFGTLHQAHHQSKGLAARAEAPPGAGCPGGHFTKSQRDAWRGHFVAAFEEHGVRGGLLQDLADFVDRAMPRYGPFANDRPSDAVADP